MSTEYRISLNRIVSSDEVEFYPNDKESVGHGDYCGTDINNAFDRCARDTAKLASWEISETLDESSTWPEVRPFNSRTSAQHQSGLFG
mgnify:FL=1